MSEFRRLLGATLLMFPAIGIAADITWTASCATLTSVRNYMAVSNQFFVTVSPSPPNCGGDISGVPGAIPFTVGKNGVTDSNVKGLFDTALSAYTASQKVTVGYDKSTQACYGMVIVIGSPNGPC